MYLSDVFIHPCCAILLWPEASWLRIWNDNRVAKRHKQELWGRNKVTYVDHNTGITVDCVLLLSANTLQPAADFVKGIILPRKRIASSKRSELYKVDWGKRGCPLHIESFFEWLSFVYFRITLGISCLFTPLRNSKCLHWQRWHHTGLTVTQYLHVLRYPTVHSWVWSERVEEQGSLHLYFPSFAIGFLFIFSSPFTSWSPNSQLKTTAEFTNINKVPIRTHVLHGVLGSLVWTQSDWLRRN